MARDIDDDISVADAGKFLGLSVAAWIVIVVVALTTGAAVWGINVATSGVRGAGDVRVQRDRADNRVSAQAFFEQTHADIKAFDQQIGDATAELNAFTAAPVPDEHDLVAAETWRQEVNARRTTLAGLVQQCRNATASYNAEARKTLRADWRAKDLPYQIDPANPETDCKGPAQ